jgi:quinate dehydrogenase
LAERLSWLTIEGTHVIGYQIEEQWRAWEGDEAVEKMDKAGAWSILMTSAEERESINFTMVHTLSIKSFDQFKLAECYTKQ